MPPGPKTQCTPQLPPPLWRWNIRWASYHGGPWTPVAGTRSTARTGRAGGDWEQLGGEAVELFGVARRTSQLQSLFLHETDRACMRWTKYLH